MLAYIWCAHFCVKLYFILAFVQKFNHFDSQPLETVERRFLHIYRCLYSHLYGPMLHVLHLTCPKISNFRTSEASHPSCPISNCSTFQTFDIYFCSLYENPTVRHTCFWYLQIFSHVFPWPNFKYWITFQLSWFGCKSATVKVLHNFSNVLADWYFSWLYLNFHWLSFCEFSSGVFFSLA